MCSILKSILRFKYSWAPFLCGMTWISTIITLFILWLINGPPEYKQNRTIIFISYVGAKWKEVFVVGCSTTAFFYFVTLILDVELRRQERIPAFLRRQETIFAILSVIFGSLAAISLVLLAVIDLENYYGIHWIITGFFLFFTFLNSVFNLLEIKYLARSHYKLGYLRRNAYAKLFLGTSGVVFAFIFILLDNICDNDNDACDVVDSTASVFEWLIALNFFGFMMTYVVDFRAVEEPPASLQILDKIEQQEQQQRTQQEEQQKKEQQGNPTPMGVAIV